MTAPTIQPRQQQLRLWPGADDDALIYEASDAYRRLDDTGQRIVRAYLVALDQSGDWPTQSRVASLAHLSRTTVSAHMAKGSPEMAAITEILSASRDELAQRSSIAIPALAALIIQQFFPSSEGGRLPRDTRSLTKVELEVLRTASIMGGVALGPDGSPASLTLAAKTSDGATVAAQLTVQPVSASLSEMVSKLRSGVQCRHTAGGEHDLPDSVQQGTDQSCPLPTDRGGLPGRALADGSLPDG